MEIVQMDALCRIRGEIIMHRQGLAELEPQGPTSCFNAIERQINALEKLADQMEAAFNGG